MVVTSPEDVPEGDTVLVGQEVGEEVTLEVPERVGELVGVAV